MKAPALDVPGWEYDGGAVWRRHEGESDDARRPHLYNEMRGHLWRWNPAGAGTGVWEIKLLHSLDGKQTAARASVGPVALDELLYARAKYLSVSDSLHEQGLRAVRVWMPAAGAVWLRSLAFHVPLEAERVALREGLEWPLHLALACEQLRGLL